MNHIATIFNLNTSEKVILHTLQSSKQPMILADISRKASLPRMTCHDAIKSLIARGLISIQNEGSKKLYMLGDIDELFISIKKHFTNDKQGESKSLSDEVTVYHGINYCHSIWKKLAHLKKGERAIFAQPNQCIETVMSKLGIDSLYPNNDALNEKGIIVEALLHKDVHEVFYNALAKAASPEFAQKEIEKVAKRTSDIRFIDNKYLNIPTEMMFFRNTAYLINWKDEVAVEIKNKIIINFLYELYELARGYGTKVNQSEYARKLAHDIKQRLAAQK